MMTLTIAAIPSGDEAAKDANRGHFVSGGVVVMPELLKALVRHGRVDKYLLVVDTPAAAAGAYRTIGAEEDDPRVEAVLLDDLATRRHIERNVLFTPDAALDRLAYLRANHGRACWPVTGLTHKLSHPRGMEMTLASMLAGLQPYDALVCSSHAGRQVIDNMLACTAGRLAARTGGDACARFKRPVIPLAVDTARHAGGDREQARRLLDIPPDQTVFLYIGRLSVASKMDPFPLLLAFRDAFAHDDDAMLILAGDDTIYRLAPELEKFAATLGMLERVRVLPNITSAEKDRLYAAADVFVSPSDSLQETFGLTIIEAMAAGLPVIASDWSGYRESVVHGRTGMLVPTFRADCTSHVDRMTLLKSDAAIHWLLGQAAGVDYAALRGAMRTLHDHPGCRATMGAEGRRRARERYDWAVVVAQYEALWDQCLAEASAAHGGAADGAADGAIDGRTDATSFASHEYFTIFEHYATANVTADLEVGLTPLGRQFISDEVPIAPLAMDVSPFSAALTRRLARACESEPRHSIADLIGRAGQDDGRAAEIVFHHIVRLLKYGVLEIEGAAP